MAVAANKRSVMTLFSGPTDIYSHQVRIVLAEKKIEYDFEIDSPWNADSNVPNVNPLGKIPTLILEDGEPVFDSRVIVEYLNERDGRGILIPAAGMDRVRVLRQQAVADGLLDASILKVYEGRFRPPEHHVQKWLDHQQGKIDRYDA